MTGSAYYLGNSVVSTPKIVARWPVACAKRTKTPYLHPRHGEYMNDFNASYLATPHPRLARRPLSSGDFTAAQVLGKGVIKSRTRGAFAQFAPKPSLGER